MTRINDEFMEAFKHLDIICRDMFQAEKGVTTYINTMESISNGARYVPGWNATLHRLKELRRIRNIHSHEIGTSYTDICLPEDIDWLNSFYDSILNTTDPLALYRKATTPRRNISNSTPKQVAIQNLNNSNEQPSSSIGHLVRMLVGLVIVIAIIFILGTFMGTL